MNHANKKTTDARPSRAGTALTAIVIGRFGEMIDKQPCRTLLFGWVLFLLSHAITIAIAAWISHTNPKASLFIGQGIDALVVLPGLALIAIGTYRLRCSSPWWNLLATFLFGLQLFAWFHVWRFLTLFVYFGCHGSI